ncbi:MAG: lipopolysaccharide biosynthesis protein [Solirubrobacteraceae bacterium]
MAPRLSAARASVRRVLAEPLARTSAGIATSTLLSAVLGIGFWAVAARIFSAKEVGRDSALIAALLALAGIGQLNLNNVFPRFLPQVIAGRGRYVTLGYICSAAASLGLGILFVVIAPRVSPGFQFVNDSPVVLITFPLAVSAWAIFSLQDAVLTALGKAAWLPIENGLFSVARIVILPIGLALALEHTMFLAYMIPMFAAVAITNWFIANRALPEAARTNAVVQGFNLPVRSLVGYLAKDFAGTVAAQLLMAAIPLIVLSMLGAEINAYFYVPFTLVTTFDSLFLSVAASLTTEAARSPERARELARRSIRWLVTIQLPVAAGVALLAPVILIPYGEQYVKHGTGVLRILVAASVFRAVVFLYGAVARLEGRTGHLLVVQLASCCLVIGLVGGLAQSLGLIGVGLGWLGAWVVMAAATAGHLRRFIRSGTIWGARVVGDRPGPVVVPNGGVPEPS